MKDRTQNLLKNIVKEYVKSAQPVGSKFLVRACGLNLSPATIRNEMAELENEGYIYQPHTSAGRVPTEQGYRFYADNFLEPAALEWKEERMFRRIKKRNESPETFLKEAAKLLAEFSEGAAIVGFAPKDVFYTGLSNLFSQPEFRETDLVYRVSEVLDHLDRVVEKLFALWPRGEALRGLDGEVKILLGRENPFGEACGVVLSRYKLGEQAEGHACRQAGMFGILGPMRMDYGRNVSLVEYVRGIVGNK